MKQKNSFTLVELLVCISIIILLMSILLPSLHKAKKGAERINCLNNLKQVGIAFGMYSTDYDGYIPSAKLPDPEAWPFFMWNSKLVPYLSAGRKYPTNASEWLEATTRAPFNCPSKPTSFAYSYGMNTFDKYNHRSLPIRPISLQGSLSKHMLISDFGHPDFSIPNHDFLYSIPDYIKNAFRHHNKDGVLFVDGHADALGMWALNYDLTLK